MPDAWPNGGCREQVETRVFRRWTTRYGSQLALATAMLCQLVMPAAAERPERYQQDRERYRQERYQDDRCNDDRERKQSRRTTHGTDRRRGAGPPCRCRPDGPLTDARRR